MTRERLASLANYFLHHACAQFKRESYPVWCAHMDEWRGEADWTSGARMTHMDLVLNVFLFSYGDTCMPLQSIN